LSILSVAVFLTVAGSVTDFWAKTEADVKRNAQRPKVQIREDFIRFDI